MDTESLNTPTPPVGVIESLSAGFETVAGRLVLILLPLLLDLFLWMGPRLSIQPAIHAYYENMYQPALSSLDEEMQESFAGVTEALAEAADDMPALYLPLLGVPTLMAGREAAPLPVDYTPPTWEVQTPLGLIGSNALALISGFMLGGIYLALIAAQVRYGKLRLSRVVKRLPGNLIWLAILAIGLPLLFIVMYMPFMLLAAGFSMVSGILAILTDWAGRLLLLWVALFLVFTIHGLFMNDRSMFGAIWDSVRLVQWNMSATIFLMLLVILLNLSLTYIWTLAPVGSWLALVAIIGNAFISTGLIAATFVFFKDRYRYWQEMRREILAELERQQARRGEN